jgi:hypothetical protein
MVDGAYKMGSRLTTKRDPRVTSVGQILRWFKIDELPQLFNVLIGDMSLIGPRPEDPHFVKFYTEAQRRVLSVRPGMVGLSQILGRDELESYPEGLKDTEAYYVRHILPDKLERDLEYVARASLWLDLSLLARGIWATVRGAVKTQFLWRRRHRGCASSTNRLRPGGAVLLPGVHDPAGLCLAARSAVPAPADAHRLGRPLGGPDVLRRLSGGVRLLRPLGPLGAVQGR